MTGIPNSYLLDALMDYTCSSERLKLKSALTCKSFNKEMNSDLISILSRFGCREMPTPAILAQIVHDMSFAVNLLLQSAC